VKTGIAFLVAALSFVCLSAEQHASERGLAKYEGKDLQTSDDTALAAFAKSYKVTTGEEIGTNWSAPKPWLVNRFSGGNASWIVLLVYPGYEIPDVSFVEAHLFDKDWNRLAKEEFPTGYRMFIKEAKVVRELALSCDTLVIKTVSAGPFMVTQSGRKPAFEQGAFQLQHYAALGTNLHLVRISDDNGRLVRNSYRSRSPFKGPSVPARTAVEWGQSLSSTNAVEVLASLVYLTGGHLLGSEQRSPNVNQESVEDAKLFEEVLGAGTTKQTLKTLVASPIPWIAEYAKLAARLQQGD